MKLGLSRGMDTKRPRGSDRSKPCHESQLTRRSLPPYPWPPEQAQPGVSKPCRTTLSGVLRTAIRVVDTTGRRPAALDRGVERRERQADVDRAADRIANCPTRPS